MNRVSTHVLDTSLGKPAANVPVRLDRLAESGSWVLIRSAMTDQEGRCAQLLSETGELPAGRYKLSFDTNAYFAAAGLAGLYPVVELVFAVRSGETHFHLPLLLSPHGYTTYRGS